MHLLQVEEKSSYIKVQVINTMSENTTLKFSGIKPSYSQNISNYSSTENLTLVSSNETYIATLLIENYLKKHFKEHEEVYPSDVADELQLRYDLVREVFDNLEKEGKLQKKRE